MKKLISFYLLCVTALTASGQVISTDGIGSVITSAGNVVTVRFSKSNVVVSPDNRTLIISPELNEVCYIYVEGVTPGVIKNSTDGNWMYIKERIADNGEMQQMAVATSSLSYGDEKGREAMLFLDVNQVIHIAQVPIKRLLELSEVKNITPSTSTTTSTSTRLDTTRIVRFKRAPIPTNLKGQVDAAKFDFIPTGPVQNLCDDAKNIYATTYLDGTHYLVVIDKETRAVRNFESESFIKGLLCDNKGRLLIITNDGVNVFDGVSVDSSRPLVVDAKEGYVGVIALYDFSQSGAPIAIYSTTNVPLSKVDPAAAPDAMLPFPSFTSYRFKGIYVDKNGTLIVPNDSGLILLNLLK